MFRSHIEFSHLVTNRSLTSNFRFFQPQHVGSKKITYVFVETCFVPAVVAHVLFQSTWATPVEVIVCQHAKRLVGDVQGGIGREVAIMTLVSTFEKLLTYLQVGAQISRNAAFA